MYIIVQIGIIVQSVRRLSDSWHKQSKGSRGTKHQSRLFSIFNSTMLVDSRGRQSAADLLPLFTPLTFELLQGAAAELGWEAEQGWEAELGLGGLSAYVHGM